MDAHQQMGSIPILSTKIIFKVMKNVSNKNTICSKREKYISEITSSKENAIRF